MRGFLILALGLAAGTASAAQPAAGGRAAASEEPKFDTDPAWLRRPSADDMRVVWPAAAWARGKGGEAVILCKISAQGALFGCTVESESPPGEGFGRAAIALTPQMLMKPPTRNGKPVAGGTVRLPVRFSNPGGAADSAGAVGPGIARAAMAWTRAPTAADVAAAYPAKARAAGKAGYVSLACELDRDGRLRTCSTMTEEPKGFGFAAAARELTKLFQAPNRASDGKSVSGVAVHLPIAFDPEMLTRSAPVVGKPVWAGLPDSAAFQAAFGGLPAEVSAVDVTLSCTVEQGGAVRDCKVARETPAGLGIGERALPLAKGVKLATWSAEGLPTVGATVRIPFKFQLKDAAEVAARPAK